MTILWLLAALAALAAGAFGERRLRVRAIRQTERLKALTERLAVYANYNKLAAVRRLDAEETLAALVQKVADAEAELKSLRADAEASDAQAPMEFHCIDRVPRSEGPLWYVAVEALDATAPWSGVKHYALVADDPGEARKRIQERHPAPASFAIGQPVALILPDR